MMDVSLLAALLPAGLCAGLCAVVEGWPAVRRLFHFLWHSPIALKLLGEHATHAAYYGAALVAFLLHIVPGVMLPQWGYVVVVVGWFAGCVWAAVLAEARRELLEEHARGERARD